MYHSIIISGRNTYTSWEMYPTSRPHVAPPEVKTSYVDLPGADGGLDYTELLTGQTRYGYRKGSWEFMLIPESQWASVYRDLVGFLHGKSHTVILEDDPTYQYTGRLSVNSWKSEQHNSLIVIDYVLDPIPTTTSPDPVDYDLKTAGSVLRREGNAGKIIALVNNEPVVIDPSSLYTDGDSTSY